MKKIVLILCLLCPVFVHGQKDSRTRFSKAKNWQEVLVEARESNKPIFLDLFATWCAPCLKMEKETFPDPQVADFINANFIVVRVQMDTTTKDDDYVKGWREDATKWQTYATAFPTYLFYTTDGKYFGSEGGYHNPEDFLTLLKNTIDPEKNYLTQLEAFKESALNKSQLLELAYRAKNNKEDSTATKIAQQYKMKYFDDQPIDSLLNPDADHFLSTFINLFSFNDKIIQYIYTHQDTTDKKFGRWPQYSKNLTDFVISRDYIYKKMSSPTSPEWEKLEKSISKEFGRSMAKRLVLNARIFSAYNRKDYKQAVELEFRKIDTYGIDTTALGRAGVNNLIYDVAFKYVDDRSLLKKALSIMKKVIDYENSESHGHLDTYASILYKIGETENAIAIERKALGMASQNND